MNWSQRLDTLPPRVSLEAGDDFPVVVEVVEWNYRAHLSDNAPHRHTYFEICLVGAYGSGEFHVADRVHPLSPGDVFFARPGVIHQIVNTSEPLMELFWVGFRPEKRVGTGVLGKQFASFRHSEVLVRSDTSSTLVTYLWQSLRSACEMGGEAGDDLWELQVRDLRAVLLRSLIALGSETSAPAGTLLVNRLHENAVAHRRTSVKAALRYIDDNLNRRLPLAEIACHLHISPRHLTRVFCEWCGVPPATYIERARLDKAERLLLCTDKSLKEIAHEVGFEDASHFSRVFARGKGSPPGQFRRAGKSKPTILPGWHRGDSGRNLPNSGCFI